MNARAKTGEASVGRAPRAKGASAVWLAVAMMAAMALTACSRQKIDWKSAEAADSVEAYDHFIALHPDSELATQARARVAQLNEERDWKRATATDAVEGYRQFLAQHENGKWSEEARIRIENFALDGTATGPLRPTFDTVPVVRRATAAPSGAVAGVSRPAPAAAADPPRAGQFGIQVGAFSSQEAALDHWKRLQDKFAPDLHGLSGHSVPVTRPAGRLFRLQAAVGEETRARAICASLVRQSQPCVVVLPGPR